MCGNRTLDKIVTNIMEVEDQFSKIQRQSFYDSQNKFPDEINIEDINDIKLSDQKSLRDVLLSILNYSKIEQKDVTEYVFFDKNYIFNMAVKVNQLQDRKLAEYIGWKIMKKLGPYLFDELANSELKVISKHLGVNKQMSTEEKCFFTTNQVLGYFNVMGLQISNYTQILGIIKNVSMALREEILRSNWMDSSSQIEAIHKITILNKDFMPLDFKLIEENNNVDNFLPILSINEKEFLDVLTMTMQAVFKVTRFSETYYRWSNRNTNPLHANPVYREDQNSLRVPVGVLHEELFSSDAPRSVMFGSLGILFAAQMSRATYNKGSLIDHQNILRPWWTNETNENFSMIQKCFAENYYNMEQRIKEDILYTAGIKTAYRAYKDISASDHNPGLPNYLSSYTPDQLFFLSFAQTMCAKYTDEAKFVAEKYIYELNDIRVISSLQNSEEFSEAFQCGRETKMNSKPKCSLS